MNHLTVYYTYVLLSESDNNFYIGFTKNLNCRLEKHNNGLVASKSYRRPLRLIYYEACLNETDAIEREKYFKSGFGRRFLNNCLENYLTEIS